MNAIKKDLFKGILTTLVVLLVGFFLQPRLANKYIPPIRAYTLDSYIKNIVDTKEASRKDFWEFRDKYDFGTFSIDPKQQNDILFFLMDMDFIPQLSYSSRHIISIGGQTSMSKLATKSGSLLNPIVDSQSTRLLKLEDGYIFLSITPLSEEKTFNGYMDKIELVEGKNYWLEVAKITK